MRASTDISGVAVTTSVVITSLASILCLLPPASRRKQKLCDALHQPRRSCGDPPQISIRCALLPRVRRFPLQPSPCRPQESAIFRVGPSPPVCPSANNYNEKSQQGKAKTHDTDHFFALSFGGLDTLCPGGDTEVLTYNPEVKRWNRSRHTAESTSGPNRRHTLQRDPFAGMAWFGRKLPPSWEPRPWPPRMIGRRLNLMDRR